MNKKELVKKIKEAIEKNSHKNDIFKVSLFGSYLHGTANEDSDVDLLIEFRPDAMVGFFKFFDIKEDIEKNIKKRIDLLTPNGLSKFFRDDVLSQAEIIYEG